MKITLQVHKDLFEETYLSLYDFNLMSNPDTKAVFFRFILFAASFIILVCFQDSIGYFVWILLILVGLGTLYSGILLDQEITALLRQKRDALKYIKDTQNITESVLEIGDNGFLLKLDENEWFQKWDTISSINIQQEYIFIFAPASPN